MPESMCFKTPSENLRLSLNMNTRPNMNSSMLKPIFQSPTGIAHLSNLDSVKIDASNNTSDMAIRTDPCKYHIELFELSNIRVVKIIGLKI